MRELDGSSLGEVASSTRAWALINGALGSSLIFLVIAVVLAGSQMDDPHIFARYATNLWRYGDVLWNPGEARVEGFSSWIWLGVYAIGVTHTSSASRRELSAGRRRAGGNLLPAR
jgi:hypothetical protein